MPLREIVVADIPALFRVRTATWHNDNCIPELAALGITPATVERDLRDIHRGWVAEEDGRIVGFAMGDRTSGEMLVIAVLKEYEGRGLGRALLTTVERWLASCGWTESFLTTDPDETVRAVGFYRRCGWSDWKIERGDRYMRKTLAP